MSKISSSTLGTEPIGKLLFRQAVPASIGILVMSLNILVDTIFVGNWIGANAIAGINVVLPVSFFIAALGMSIGIGGASIISRALGANNREKAIHTFGNEITLTLILTILFVTVGLIFTDSLVKSFGGKGDIFTNAKTYYEIVMYGIPFQALNMMGNNSMRAEGKPKYAMIAMIIPSISNLILDYIFINILGWGMTGAAWATTGSTILCFLFVFWFFMSDKSELKISMSHLGLQKSILKEIASLGFVTLSRQAVVSIIYLFLNNILFNIGGEASVAVFAIIGRMLMFALFPVLGVTQGFLPIAGYNYGAEKYQRVIQSLNTAIISASILATVVFAIIMIFPQEIVRVFLNDKKIIEQAPHAMRLVFAATPIIAIQMIGAAFFQSIGKAVPALLLTLTRQGFFFIPLLFILPHFLGELGVWLSFPIADFLSTIVTGYFLNREVRKKLKPFIASS
ncbi:MATE family efflux transporter [Zhouia sp. PK063]|uniref:MATE family efflux transporter n=1 Tax=Zhouia sp. PK063 TaxID=3373602 RepID=UPI0037A62D71